MAGGPGSGSSQGVQVGGTGWRSRWGSRLEVQMATEDLGVQAIVKIVRGNIPAEQSEKVVKL